MIQFIPRARSLKWTLIWPLVAASSVLCSSAFAQQSVSGGAASADHRVQVAYEAWRKRPQSEVDCIDQSLRARGSSVRHLIQRGVWPSDDGLASVRATCRTREKPNVTVAKNAGNALAAEGVVTKRTETPLEKIPAQKSAPEKAAAEVAAAETATVEAAAADKAALEAIAAERAAEKATVEKAAAEKIAAEKVAAEKAATEKAAVAKAAAEKAAAEKIAAEKATADKIAAEKAAAEKAVVEKLVAEKLAAERAAEKAAAEKAATEALAVEKAAADKAAADKAAAAKVLAEKTVIEKTVADAPRADAEHARFDVAKAQLEAERVRKEAEKAIVQMGLALSAAESRISFVYGLVSGFAVAGLGAGAFLAMRRQRMLAVRKPEAPSSLDAGPDHDEIERMVAKVIADQQQRARAARVNSARRPAPDAAARPAVEDTRV